MADDDHSAAGAVTSERVFADHALLYIAGNRRACFVGDLLRHGVDIAEPDTAPWARPQAWTEKMNRTKVLTVLRECGG